MNRHGFRFPDLPFEKPEGTRRIALIGDSMIAAEEVAEEDTAAWRLAERLEAADPAHDLGGPELRDAGVGHRSAVRGLSRAGAPLRARPGPVRLLRGQRLLRQLAALHQPAGPAPVLRLRRGRRAGRAGLSDPRPAPALAPGRALPVVRVAEAQAGALPVEPPGARSRADGSPGGRHRPRRRAAAPRATDLRVDLLLRRGRGPGALLGGDRGSARAVRRGDGERRRAVRAGVPAGSGPGPRRSLQPSSGRRPASWGRPSTRVTRTGGSWRCASGCPFPSSTSSTVSAPRPRPTRERPRTSGCTSTGFGHFHPRGHALVAELLAAELAVRFPQILPAADGGDR